MDRTIASHPCSMVGESVDVLVDVLYNSIRD